MLGLSIPWLWQPWDCLHTGPKEGPFTVCVRSRMAKDVMSLYLKTDLKTTRPMTKEVLRSGSTNHSSLRDNLFQMKIQIQLSRKNSTLTQIRVLLVITKIALYQRLSKLEKWSLEKEAMFMSTTIRHSKTMQDKPTFLYSWFLTQYQTTIHQLTVLRQNVMPSNLINSL